MSDLSEAWQQQHDELVALSSIFVDSFRPIRVPGLDLEQYNGSEDLYGLPEPGGDLSDREVKFEVQLEVVLPNQKLSLMIDMSGDDGSMMVAVGPPVSYLPPLCVKITLPPTYPLIDPPSFSLSAIWLPTDSSPKLLSMLHAMWEEGGGSCCCWGALDWLQNNCLESLGVSGEIVVTSKLAGGGRGPDQGSIVSAEHVALSIIRYSATKEMDAFRSSTHRCAICFDDLPGSKFVLLSECGDAFCSSCMTHHCRTQVQDGAVDNVKCPNPECRKQLIPDTLKSLLSEDEFVRWEALLLQRTLDRMSDVVYCPRCSSVVIEDQDHMGACQDCLFVFCSLCDSSWHPGDTCVDPEQKLAILQRRAQRLDGGGDDRRKHADLVNQMQSLKLLSRVSKPCPACGMGISKTEGCNKMTCAYCSKCFCWKCCKVINDYDHFSSSSCQLFDIEEVNAWNARMAGAVAARRIRDLNQDFDVGALFQQDVFRPCVCPVCGQHNFKLENNNNIQCWSCNQHFCYSCRTRLGNKPGTHFGVKGCRQHSAD